MRASFRSSAGPAQLVQGGHPHAGGPLALVLQAVGAVPGGAGDVQVEPGGVPGKGGEEHARGNGPAAVVAAVVEVRQGALDQLLVLGVVGHAPELLSAPAGGGLELVIEVQSPPLSLRR